MRKTILILVMIIFSTVGIIDSGYITYEKMIGQTPPCSALFKCGEVLNSPYASVGLIPLSVFGLAFYTVFLVISSWYLLNLDMVDTALERKIQKTLFLMGLFGFGFTLYLLLIMGVVLKAWCFYCLLSAINCVVLFGSSLAIYLSAKRHQSHAMYL